MNIDQQILFSVSALGALNGLVLSFYLLFSKKGKSVIAFMLGVLLLAISIRVAKSVFLYFNPQLPKIYLQIGLSACFLIGPSLYYFFKLALSNIKEIPVAWKWTWGIQLAIIVLTGIIFPYKTAPKIWNNIIVYFIYGQWFIYVIATGVLFKNVIKTFFTGPSNLKVAEKFWLLVYLGNCIIFLFYLLALLGIMCGIYISGPLWYSLFLFLTIFYYLYIAKIENVLDPEETEPSNKTEKRKITQSEAALWIEKLEKVIREKELYKDPNLKLNDLAKKINISGHLLSQLLNENLGKSFPTYINEYRINEACKLITSNSNLSFEAIGYEAGFNSKSTFYTAFKKVKNITPADFKESIEKNDNK